MSQNFGIPKYLLKRMLPKDAIQNTPTGFVIKALNVMSPFLIEEIPGDISQMFYFMVDGELIDVHRMSLTFGAKIISMDNAQSIIGETLPMGSVMELNVKDKHLTPGKHQFLVTVTPPGDPEIKINFDFDVI